MEPTFRIQEVDTLFAHCFEFAVGHTDYTWYDGNLVYISDHVEYEQAKMEALQFLTDEFDNQNIKIAFITFLYYSVVDVVD